MRPREQDRNVTVSGAQASAQFGIDKDSEAFVMGILRDSLYSNKILAVLREYACNAVDAHREAGLDTPIKIRLPNRINPELVIRDFGAGLSEEDVLTLYTKYGKSTRRGSDIGIGMFGIGCKCGFAYSDAFTIVSHFDGTKSIYGAYLDETKLGVMSLLSREPTEETGMEIRIPAQEEDFDRFEREAQNLYRFFSPWPDINIPLVPIPGSVKLSGFFTADYADRQSLPHQWTAVMGGIPYRINWDFESLGEAPNTPHYQRAAGSLADVACSHNGGLFFDIGDVDFDAAREQLEMTERTREALKTRLDDLVTEVVEDSKKLSEAPRTRWKEHLNYAHQMQNAPRLIQARIHQNSKHRWDNVPLWRSPLSEVDSEADVKDNKLLEEEEGHLLVAPKTFRLATYRVNQHWSNRRRGGGRYSYSYGKTSTVCVPVKDRTVVVVKDCTPVGPRLHEIHECAIVVVPAVPDVAVNLVELQRYLAHVGLTGIPVKKLSEYEPSKEAELAAEHVPTAHYAKRLFKNKESLDSYRYSGMRSENWDIVTEPPPEGLYVVINRFKPVDYRVTQSNIDQAKKVLAAIGVVVPKDLYGIKQLVGKKLPVPPGWEKFTDWAVKQVQHKIVTDPSYKEALQSVLWDRLGLDVPEIVPTRQGHLLTELWADINYFKRTYRRGCGAIYPHTNIYDEVTNLLDLWDPDTLKELDPAISGRLSEIYGKYPMLQWTGMFGFCDDKQRETYVQYVDTMDAL